MMRVTVTLGAYRHIVETSTVIELVTGLAVLGFRPSQPLSRAEIDYMDARLAAKLQPIDCELGDSDYVDSAIGVEDMTP
jgi:hypothetical protein